MDNKQVDKIASALAQAVALALKGTGFVLFNIPIVGWLLSTSLNMLLNFVFSRVLTELNIVMVKKEILDDVAEMRRVIDEIKRTGRVLTAAEIEEADKKLKDAARGLIKF